MIRIGILDDDEIFIDFFLEIVSEYENIECVTKNTNSSSLFKLLKFDSNIEIDYLFLDIHLKNESGIDLISNFKKLLPNTEIIMLTIDGSNKSLFKALIQGANGYLIKEKNAVDFNNIFKIIMDGGAIISPEIAKILLSYFSPKSIISDLTVQENQILYLLVAGLSYKDIADKMGLTIDGIRYHIKKMYKTLKINSRYELIYNYPID